MVGLHPVTLGWRDCRRLGLDIRVVVTFVVAKNSCRLTFFSVRTTKIESRVKITLRSDLLVGDIVDSPALNGFRFLLNSCHFARDYLAKPSKHAANRLRDIFALP